MTPVRVFEPEMENADRLIAVALADVAADNSGMPFGQIFRTVADARSMTVDEVRKVWEKPNVRMVYELESATQKFRQFFATYPGESWITIRAREYQDAELALDTVHERDHYKLVNDAAFVPRDFAGETRRLYATRWHAYIVTLGQKYRTERHPVAGAHPDGWFTFYAVDERAARTAACEVLGNKWSGLYGEENFHGPETAGLFPRGEIRVFYPHPDNA